MRASCVLHDYQPSRQIPAPRLILDAGIRDPEGDPRPCVRWPDRAALVAYRSIADAVRAMQAEGRRHG